MIRRPLFALVTTIVLGTAAASPATDAKAALGGVIDEARAVKIGAMTYLLVTRRPYVGGWQRVLVLKPFAGTYITLWTGSVEHSGNPGNLLLATDLTDLNRDGRPEVLLAYEEAGNASGIDTYVLTDLADSTRYTVEIGYTQNGTPGTVTSDESLETPNAAAFRTYLEERVAKSERLKDTRNAFSKASDDWYEQYGAFLNNKTSDSLKVTPITAAYGSELCTTLSGSVQGTTFLGGIEYRSIFRFGVLAFNPGTQQCALIFATPGDLPGPLTVLGDEVQIPLEYSGQTAIWNPQGQTLRWK